MPDFSFSIERAHVVGADAQRAIALRVRIVVAPPETHVYSLSLHYGVQIDAMRRHYAADEQQRLISLFGPVGCWYGTLHSLPWLTGTAQVPAFIGESLIELLLPCRGEVSFAVKRYLEALSFGEALLVASFSGAGFVASDSLPMQMSRIPWDRQATFRLPLRVWHEATERNAPAQNVLHLA